MLVLIANNESQAWSVTPSPSSPLAAQLMHKTGPREHAAGNMKKCVITGRCNLDDIIFWEVDVELNLKRWTIQICMTFSLFQNTKIF